MPAPSLSNSDLMDEYVASCVDLHRQWQRLLPAERRARIQDAVRVAARGAALPDFSFNFRTMVGRGGELSALDWCLNIEKTVSEEHAVTKERFLWFCSGLYHESRHGEQWFQCAHGVVRGELTNRWLDGTAPQRLPEHVARTMLLPRAVVEAAEARGGASWAAYRREQAVEAWFDSIWGIARGWRGRVLAHPDLMVDGTAAHARYLALPEEVDAYALQHAIEAQMDPLLPADPPQAPPLPAIAVRQVAIQPPVSALDAQIRAVQLRHVPMEDRSYETSAVRRLVAAHAALIARQ